MRVRFLFEQVLFSKEVAKVICTTLGHYDIWSEIIFWMVGAELPTPYFIYVLRYFIKG